MTEATDIYASLFELAQSADDDLRNTLLKRENIKLAGQLQNNRPDRWRNLARILSEWDGFEDLRQHTTAYIAQTKAIQKKQKTVEAAQKRVDEAAENGRPVVPMGKPALVAQLFRDAHHPHLLWLDKAWLEWDVNAYVVREEDAIRAGLQQWLQSGVDAETGEPVHPDKRGKDDIMDALRSLCFRGVKETGQPPLWFNYWQGVDPDPHKVIPAHNAMLVTDPWMVLPNSPRYFTRNGLDFDYDQNPPEPEVWFAFLESLWPTNGVPARTAARNRETRNTLQEIMGHLLTGETKYQKIFLFVGAARGGKGTIYRVIAKLVGEGNAASKPINEMGKSFSSALLIGKQVFMIADARVGKSTNISAILEQLLGMSGEDATSVSRKYLNDWEGTLRARVIVATNRDLTMPDQAGAYSDRLLPIVFKRNFSDKADPELQDKLDRELPGILNWALEGLRRLEARRDPETGRQLGFVLPVDSRAALRDINLGGSPIRQFLREWCIIDPKAKDAKGAAKTKIEKDLLLEALLEWCELNDVPPRWDKEDLTPELKAASGSVIEPARLRKDGDLVQYYVGVTLKPEAERLRPDTTEGPMEDEEVGDGY